MELQTCDFEPAAGSAPETPSNSRPEVGFLNPEPLATRCTTKDNDGLGEGGVAALRSSWIQRLFPGMLGESVRPAQWKGKHIAPDYENTERLLIENAAKLAEDSGLSPQLLGAGQDLGRENRHGGLGPVIREEVSSTDILLPCTNSSQPQPVTLCGQGLPPARESYRAIRGLAGEVFVKSAMDIGHLSDNSRDLTGLSSQQASVDHSANSTKFTKGLTCNRPFFDHPRQQDMHARDVGYSQIRDVDNASSSMMKQEAEKNMKASLNLSYRPSAEVDTRSIQVGHNPVQRHSLRSRNVSKIPQQREQIRYGLNGLDTIDLQAESPSRLPRKSELQPGGTRNISDSECLVAGGAVGGGLRVDTLETGEKTLHQGQYGTDRGQNVGSLGSSPLPPLSLFAPFKHNKERRSVESQGKNKMAADLSEDSLLTPLFPSCGYKTDPNDNLGGAGVSEDKFHSTMFATYKPLSSFKHSTGLRGLETTFTLTPIFAPFKTAEEQNRPSNSLIKTNVLPLDVMEHNGEDAVGQDTEMDVDVLPEPKAQPADHRGQPRNQPRADGHISSVSSDSPLPIIADQRDAAMFSLNSGPRFNDRQCRVEAVNVQGSSLKGRCHTVNTTAIELSSSRPSLQEERTDEKDPSTPQSHDIQPSVSQGTWKCRIRVPDCVLSAGVFPLNPLGSKCVLVVIL